MIFRRSLFGQNRGGVPLKRIRDISVAIAISAFYRRKDAAFFYLTGVFGNSPNILIRASE